jgi:A/G-specific adenine glycosylase
MAALPGGEWTVSEPPQLNAIGTVRHVFTHFSLDLHVVVRSEPESEGWWEPIDRVGSAGLPTLYRKIVDLILSTNDRLAA